MMSSKIKHLTALLSMIVAVSLFSACGTKLVEGDTPLKVESESAEFVNNFKLLSWNIQDGMWCDQFDDYVNFVAYINDPVEEAISILLDSKKKPVDLTLYAGESKNTFGVLYLEANEKNIFAATGLDADLEAALNGSVAFETETLNSALSFDKTTGVITVADQGMEIQGDHKVVVKVVYSYKFGSRDFAVEYVVKPGVRQ